MSIHFSLSLNPARPPHTDAKRVFEVASKRDLKRTRNDAFADSLANAFADVFTLRDAA